MKHKFLSLTLAAALAAGGLAGCANAQAATGGTLLGALIGGNIGAHMDAQDRMNAAQALNNVPDGRAATWRNPNTHARYAVVPQRTYQVSNGQYCREYLAAVVVGAREQRAYGTACRQPDGSWKIVSDWMRSILPARPSFRRRR